MPQPPLVSRLKAEIGSKPALCNLKLKRQIVVTDSARSGVLPVRRLDGPQKIQGLLVDFAHLIVGQNALAPSVPIRAAGIAADKRSLAAMASMRGSRSVMRRPLGHRR